MAADTIIVVDIGNTSTHVSLERAGRFLLTKRFSSFTSQNHTRRIVRRLLRFYASRSKINGAILCSVVPALGRVWLAELKRSVNGRVLQVNHKLNLGIKIDYPKPAKIGADRLANAVAAAEKYGAPVIVADFGTALTFDIVSAPGTRLAESAKLALGEASPKAGPRQRRAYIGGIIAPGPMLFVEYLAAKTALLPSLSLSTIRKAMLAKGKAPVIGKNTRQAMLIGLRLGYLGMVKEIISRMKREQGLKNARLCATGGYAGLILSKSGLAISIDPFLTLRGISRIYWLNR